MPFPGLVKVGHKKMLLILKFHVSCPSLKSFYRPTTGFVKIQAYKYAHIAKQ